ncbi:MAG: lipid-binding SYLF domain-containing protein [Rhodospirillaceae bacterium]|nr:lipid-binding SYLF domain-containing protein [Rhodospirillaceae bacterium]
MQLSRRTLLGGLAAAGGLELAGLGLARSAFALSPQQEMIDRSRITLEKLTTSPDTSELPGFIRRARGVLIFPEVFKAGFILGAEGGGGVALVRDDTRGWSDPAFYTLVSGSIGLQIGGQVAEMVLTIMTQESIDALIDNQFKFGGNISIAFGPVGKGLARDSTTALNADVYAFALTKGLFGGLSLEGAGILKRDSWNQAYYGFEATPFGILIARRFSNPNAAPLVQALTATAS